MQEDQDDSTAIPEEDEEQHNDDPTSNMPGHFRPDPGATHAYYGPGTIPMFPMLRQARGHAPFRVGFAGRGRFNVPGGIRGRGMGQSSGDGQ